MHTLLWNRGVTTDTGMNYIELYCDGDERLEVKGSYVLRPGTHRVDWAIQLRAGH
ncbi:hypothetical protein [Paenibacillus sedimenti]|uniref:Uncharacterized protein n=1 Tax=Paenibacillus sedimenti TaxID=2770274 RepID=A0A926KMZ7_9BACL|nr:hypothetical protein [Paenibacillus sedimenti]MBD0379761.1 hypothetical protein [Paenibacillus sedimenti]